MQTSNHTASRQDHIEIQHYVQLMRKYGINTIVEMNKYISKNNMWNNFSNIRRENTYNYGFTSIGISKDAYKSICELYQTEDTITSSLVRQKRI